VWNETIPLTGGTVWHVVHTESDPPSKHTAVQYQEGSFAPLFSQQ